MKHIDKFDEAAGPYGMYQMARKMSGQVMDEITDGEARAIVRVVVDHIKPGTEATVVEYRYDSFLSTKAPEEISTKSHPEWEGIHSPEVNCLSITTEDCVIDVTKTTDDWWWVCVGVPALSGRIIPCELCDGLSQALVQVRLFTKRFSRI